MMSYKRKKTEHKSSFGLTVGNYDDVILCALLTAFWLFLDNDKDILID